MTTLTELFADGAQALGTWTQIGAPETIDILGAAGFDFTIVDTEHGSFGMEAVENLVRACDAVGIVPIVRVPWLEQAHVTRALDAGAAGVIVPGVRSAAEAERAIRSGRFQPAGARGACPCVRAGDHFVRDWPAYVTRRERDTGIIVLAETAGALAEIDAICALPGLRALMIGPFDLSVALGCQGDCTHPDLVAAVRRMLAAARAHGVPAIMPIFAPDVRETQRQVVAWRAEGVRAFTIGTDKILLFSQCAQFVTGLGITG
jgi:4-hydroxy-2-oxoheptanedioate aldolase